MRLVSFLFFFSSTCARPLRFFPYFFIILTRRGLWLPYFLLLPPSLSAYLSTFPPGFMPPSLGSCLLLFLLLAVLLLVSTPLLPAKPRLPRSIFSRFLPVTTVGHKSFIVAVLCCSFFFAGICFRLFFQEKYPPQVSLDTHSERKSNFSRIIE